SYYHIGCFADQRVESRAADRSMEMGFTSYALTPEACYTHCSDGGFQFMGLQFGYECYCGSMSDAEQDTQFGASDCDITCMGDESSTCGGYWSFDLYVIHLSEPMAPTPAPTISTPQVDEGQSEKQILLDLHNEARCLHGADPVVWNDSAEATSKAHAEYLTTPDKCGYLFYSDVAEHGYGENLYLCYGQADCMLADGVLESFYGFAVDDGPVTGYEIRAKRLLWKSTTELGCSIDSCVFENVDVEVLVCNYDPIGDYADDEATEQEVGLVTGTIEECQQGPASGGTPAPFMTASASPTADVATPAPSTADVPTPGSTLAPFTATTPPSPSSTFPPQSVPSTDEPVPSTPSPTPSTTSPAEATSPPSGPAPGPASTPAPTSSTTTAPVASPEEPSPSDGACSTNPCLNGGTCEVDPNGGYTCVCSGSYAGMTCETDTSSLPEFFITVDFIGTWTQSRQDVFQSAADRWAEVLTHIPCTGTNGDGGSAGELVITSTLESIDGPSGTLGFAGPRGIWNECQGISYSGEMTFDLDDIDDMESQGTFEGVILHEMGHVIGVGTLWGECSECDEANDPEWKCPLAAQVYNDLAGNAADSPADIIELDGGEGTGCGHFSEETFEDELMTGYVNAGSMPLSKITTASLADRGYVVKPSMADEYTIPALRSPSARQGNTTTYEALDEDGADIEVCDREGNIVGTIPGKRFRF
ncbi:unnamed protein product, partial [Scytosiphon promiscuus]